MPTYLTRDAAAFALGLTPRYGFAWPSASDGRMALPTGPARPALWAQREGVELFACVGVGMAAFLADMEPTALVATGACVLLAARSLVRGAIIRRPRRTRG